MAKKAYVGVDGVARKIKKGYIGVGGLARKIKKAYIGVGGVARPCWSGGELSYYGTVTGLSVASRSPAATSFGDYAMFGGGTQTDVIAGVVDVYNKSLTRTTPDALEANEISYSSYFCAATSVGNYALFEQTRGTQVAINAYDTSFTRSCQRPSFGIYATDASTIGNYALFFGSTIRVVDASLTVSKLTETSYTAKRFSASTVVGNYALVGGGVNGSSYYTELSETVAIDTSLTATIPTELGTARCYLAATTVGNYALFGGGASDGYLAAAPYFSVVDAYDASLTRTTPTALSVARCALAASTVGNYALFGGGCEYESYCAVVDVYDASLTRTTSTALSVARCALAASTVGNYALFAGGHDITEGNSVLHDVVDAYTVA